MKSRRRGKMRQRERMKLRRRVGTRVWSSKEERSTEQVGRVSLNGCQEKPPAARSLNKGSQSHGLRTRDFTSASARSERASNVWKADPRLKVFVLKSPVTMAGPGGTRSRRNFIWRLRQRAVPKTSRCVFAMTSDRPKPHSKRTINAWRLPSRFSTRLE